MKKVIRDGKVAVILHGTYGPGWAYGCDGLDDLKFIYHPGIVEWIEAGKSYSIKHIEKELGYDDDDEIPRDLKIEWVELGREFMIDAYDGKEFIVYKDEINWITA